MELPYPLAENWQKQILAELLEFSDCGILVINTNYTIIAVNDWACQFMDVPRSTFLNAPITDFFPRSILVKVLQSGVAQREQIAMRNNKKMLVTRLPLTNNGKVTGAVAIFKAYDYPDRTEAEVLEEKGFVAKYSFQDIIYQSRKLEHVIATAKSYAKTSSTILITGESGVGKELFAQSIHNYSPRKNKPFVTLNCATLSETALETELFGDFEEKEGLFQLANGGTIFLDEIGDIPMSFQSKFLRALQEKEIRPVGSDYNIPVDVRVIAATNKNLYESVQQGNFRLDLLYRINVLNLHIPPLRERREDISAIAANYFDSRNFPLYAQNKDLIYAVLSALRDHSFPGNIRELENILERLNLLLSENLLEKDVRVILGQLIDGNTYQALARPSTVKGSLEMEERQTIIDLLMELKGNKSAVAKALGISTSTLWRRMKEYDIK